MKILRFSLLAALSQALPSQKSSKIETRKCHIHAPTIDDCIGQCALQSHCDCVTYYPENKQCQLKEEDDGTHMKMDGKAQTVCKHGVYIGMKIDGGDIHCEH
ncbi:Oidioi.mRNA.OKI2018_I69.PAR.g8585.t1.cds [Oikopleura dioica]|uniref:Oidioi.mRNA.OKI2018_I69.PAR.g8585.t1.cds n=1 Tax=Oikopleura dioica TaxID=34765 RepID=A0ABN7RGK9_OIKDI|nr:Oidioi.mRNA.OKI2018_I69.PAR.g8585.t1.cds [Oikopleura dioica]